ncbi:AglZ/HisF2 family acetamidino modification protein [Agrobacterium sp. Azo12]|jgi:cyclase|uniref:AglZ/HisF2 family acetamidino modification protein n=1 Tax=Agrobacterium sp. Azo12 TaxID=3031129 RepID=UPI0023D8C787|nr:AglZ/HisF2 family acetamidino modification protein [Agrobacterium sp. Azo12]MDO5896980.1 AglZ/HisF2 family acetamidino modification protein [Agrobacterium sp. Azo12]
MLKARIIPCLLLKGRGLYKTVKFSDPKYVGDPVNAVKIFNEKEVDELLVLDITATAEKREPNFELIGDIAGECFMPLAYGGGVSSLEQIRRLQRVGVEKVSLNSAAFHNRDLVKDACLTFGTSSIVAAIDVKKSFFGKYEVWINAGKTNTKEDPIRYAEQLARLGVGEILVNSIDRDGTMGGLDTNLLKSIVGAVDTPVIACGGAGNLTHLHEGISCGVNAVAAGSMFVFHGKHKAVLINYPSGTQLEEIQLESTRQ